MICFLYKGDCINAYPCSSGDGLGDRDSYMCKASEVMHTYLFDYRGMKQVMCLYTPMNLFSNYSPDAPSSWEPGPTRNQHPAARNQAS